MLPNPEGLPLLPDPKLPNHSGAKGVAVSMAMVMKVSGDVFGYRNFKLMLLLACNLQKVKIEVEGPIEEQQDIEQQEVNIQGSECLFIA